MMSDFEQYRLWIVAIFGSISIFILASIWRYYYQKRRKIDEQLDFGLLFLCAGLSVWVISAIIGLSTEGMSPDVRHALSMINNGLIACSFPFFEYSVIPDKNAKARKYWVSITLSLSLFVLILIFAFGNHQNGVLIGNLLDFLSTSLILVILTGILFKTFDKRKLKPLGYGSIFVTVAMLISQFFITFRGTDLVKCNENTILEDMGFIMGGISFAMFILLLVALSFTWILEQSHVYNEWKDQEVIGRTIETNPSKALDYLYSLISSGLSKYDLEAFRSFFHELPLQISKRPEYTQIYHDFLSASAQLNNIVDYYLQGLIDFDTYQQNYTRVRVNLLTVIDRLRGLFNINHENLNN